MSETVYNKETLPLASLQDKPVNGKNKVLITNHANNTVHIQTSERLTNRQLQDLFWIVLAMVETGEPYSALQHEWKED